MNLPVISCDGCGVCCLKMGTPPFVRHEIFDLPEDLRDEVLQYEKNEPNREWSEKPCYWHDPDTLRCLNYEHRPTICRDFKVGSPSCLNWRADAGLDQ